MAFVDDKSDHCINFILGQISLQASRDHECSDQSPAVLFIGLNGLQGVGKTTLVSTLVSTLSSPPYSLPTLALSIDDFYLPYQDLQSLAQANPSNPLLHHRGQPSTHDIPLLLSTFSLLEQGLPTKIPEYDKSAFDGKGDRLSEERWVEWNALGGTQVRVVILEGWCVGFQSLGPERMRRVWEETVMRKNREDELYCGRLGHQSLENVLTIDEALKGYERVFDQLDAFIHIDAEDTQYVYAWRLEQEVALREKRGMGMTDEQVRAFVDGYYPSYELYLDGLRNGFFTSRDAAEGGGKKEIRFVVGRDRRLKDVIEM